MHNDTTVIPVNENCPFGGFSAHGPPLRFKTHCRCTGTDSLERCWRGYTHEGWFQIVQVRGNGGGLILTPYLLLETVIQGVQYLGVLGGKSRGGYRIMKNNNNWWGGRRRECNAYLREHISSLSLVKIRFHFSTFAVSDTTHKVLTILLQKKKNKTKSILDIKVFFWAILWTLKTILTLIFYIITCEVGCSTFIRVLSRDDGSLW